MNCQRQQETKSMDEFEISVPNQESTVNDNEIKEQEEKEKDELYEKLLEKRNTLESEYQTIEEVELFIFLFFILLNLTLVLIPMILSGFKLFYIPLICILIDIPFIYFFLEPEQRTMITPYLRGSIIGFCGDDYDIGDDQPFMIILFVYSTCFLPNPTPLAAGYSIFVVFMIMFDCTEEVIRGLSTLFGFNRQLLFERYSSVKQDLEKTGKIKYLKPGESVTMEPGVSYSFSD